MPTPKSPFHVAAEPLALAPIIWEATGSDADFLTVKWFLHSLVLWLWQEPQGQGEVAGNPLCKASWPKFWPVTKGVAQIVVFTQLNRLKPDQPIKNGSSNRESSAVNISKSEARAWIIDKVQRGQRTAIDPWDFAPCWQRDWTILCYFSFPQKKALREVFKVSVGCNPRKQLGVWGSQTWKGRKVNTES